MGKCLSYEEIKKRVEKKGVRLISEQYEGEAKPILVQCQCGTKVQTTYASIRGAGRSGVYRCKECAKVYSRNRLRISYSDIKKTFEENNCVLLTTEKEYKNVRSTVKYIARCGHLCETSFESYKNSKYKMCFDCTKEKYSGENSYNWKGGYDSEKIKFRKSYAFKQWVKAIYKRDGYVCQKCGQVGGKLNAHHLNGYNWDIENRLNINNGVALCENCHDNFHNMYGRGNNTKEQFEEWIKKNIKD